MKILSQSVSLNANNVLHNASFAAAKRMRQCIKHDPIKRQNAADCKMPFYHENLIFTPISLSHVIVIYVNGHRFCRLAIINSIYCNATLNEIALKIVSKLNWNESVAMHLFRAWTRRPVLRMCSQHGWYNCEKLSITGA